MSRLSSLIFFILLSLSLRVLGQFIKLTTHSLIPFPPVVNSLSASSTAWIQSWCFSSPRNSFLLSDSSLFRTACFFITNDSSSRNSKGSICPGSLACPLSSSCCSFFPHTQQVLFAQHWEVRQILPWRRWVPDQIFQAQIEKESI